MKKIYIILIVIVTILIGVSIFLIPKLNTSTNQEVYMGTMIENVYTYDQFDSLCRSDRISPYLEEWNSSIFISDHKIVKQYLYLVYKKDTMIMYSLIPESDSTFFINKRISIE